MCQGSHKTGANGCLIFEKIAHKPFEEDEMTKKVLYVIVTTLFVAAMLAACAGPATTVAPVATNPPATSVPATSAPATSAPATSVPATSAPQTHPQSDAIITVTAASQSGTTIVRNFNPFSANELFPTAYGI